MPCGLNWKRFGGCFEDLRSGAEKDRKISARDFRKGKIDEAALKASSEHYEDAIVNYYLGMRVNRDRLLSGPEKVKL